MANKSKVGANISNKPKFGANMAKTPSNSVGNSMFPDLMNVNIRMENLAKNVIDTNKDFTDVVLDPLKKLNGGLRQYFAVNREMITAIAGVVCGEKNMSFDKKYNALINKNINKTNAIVDGLYNKFSNKAEKDTSAEPEKFDDIIKSISTPLINVKEKTASAVVDVVVKGVDGKSLEKLAMIMKYVADIYQIEGIESFDTVVYGIDSLKDIAEELSKIKFKGIDDDFVKSIKAFSKVITEINNVNKSITKAIPFYVLVDMFSEKIINSPKTLTEFLVGPNGRGGLNKVFSSYMKLTENADIVNATKELVKIFKNLIPIFTYLGMIGKLSGKTSSKEKQIIKSLSIITKIIDKINVIDIQKVKGSSKNINEISKFVVSIGNIYKSLAIIGVLYIPALLGVKFGLKLLPEAITKINTVIDKLEELKGKKFDSKASKDLLKTIGLLCAIMAMVALVGTLVVTNIKGVLGFALVFSLFILSLMLPIKLLNIITNKSVFRNVYSFGYLIGTLAAIMIIGAMFMLIPKLGLSALLFGGVFMLFIITLMPAIFLMTLVTKVGGYSSLSFGRLILSLTLSMLIGAVFMLIPGLAEKSLEFTKVFSSFVYRLMIPIILFALLSKSAGNAIKDLSRLIITSTIVMLIGALVVKKLWDGAILFTVLLSAFIWGVLSPFILFGKEINRAKKSIFAVVLLVLISSLMIMIGSGIVDKYGWEKPLIFTGIVLGFVLGVSLVAMLLSKNAKNLIKGVAAAAIMVGVVMLSALAITMMADAFAKYDKPINVLRDAAIIAGFITIFGVVALALGAMTLVPVFWAGVAAAGALAAIALLISKAMLNLSIGLKTFQEVSKGGDIDTAKIQNMLGVVKDISLTVISTFKTIKPVKMMKACLGIMMMGKAITGIAKSIRDVANLNIATGYDNNGMPTGYRQMTEQDFTDAANNISKIVTTIGKALSDVYSTNKEMFESKSLSGKLTGAGETPFDKVIIGCNKMGNMIYSLATSISNMASLKVPTGYNSNGQPIGYRKLKQIDFDLAAKGIETIVTTIGQALYDVYNGHERMFTSKSLYGISGEKGETPIDKVIIGCTKMGDMMSKIAFGISDMANLRFIEEYTDDGKPKKYRSLKTEDFTKAAENIKTIITLVGECLDSVYNDHMDWFYTWWGLESSDTKIGNIVCGVNKMISVVANVADAINKIANLMFPDQWNNQGVATHYTRFDIATDGVKAAKNIETIITTLATSVVTAYDTMYKNPLFRSMDMGKISEDLNNIVGIPVSVLSKILNNNESGFGSVKTSKFKEFVEKINLTGDASKSFSTIVKNITDILKYYPFAVDGTLETKFGNLLDGIFNPLFKTYSNELISGTTFENVMDSFSKVSFDNYRNFIQDINSIDTVKADKFVKILNTVNDLSKDVGKVSKAVSDINDKVVSNLEFLAAQIKTAATTIDNAEKIQNKREEIINNSTKEIKKLMEMPLIVDVKNNKTKIDENNDNNNAFVNQQTSQNNSKNIIEQKTVENETNKQAQLVTDNSTDIKALCESINTLITLLKTINNVTD